MFGFGLGELLVVLVIVVVLFNNRLPDLGEGLGKCIRRYRKAVNQPDEIDVTPKKNVESDCQAGKRKKKERVHRGAVAEIDRSALLNNLRTIQARFGYKPVIAVVKADAYGHGSVEVARALVAQGADLLAVAFVEEARLLRSFGIEAKILVLFDQSDISACFDLNLIPVLHDKNSAVAFSHEARKRRDGYF